MIVLRSPKGWTGPKEVDGVEIEGTFRAHQVPLANLAEKPKHIKILEDWMKSYRPEELFDENGSLIAELAELAPQGGQADGGQPPRQRRPPAQGTPPARFPRLRRRRHQAGRSRGRGDQGPGQVPPRRAQA